MQSNPALEKFPKCCAVYSRSLADSSVWKWLTAGRKSKNYEILYHEHDYTSGSKEMFPTESTFGWDHKMHKPGMTVTNSGVYCMLHVFTLEACGGGWRVNCFCFVVPSTPSTI